MKFAEDWRGVFLRGDDAYAFALALKEVLQHTDATVDLMAVKQAQGLLTYLLAVDERTVQRDVQHMHDYSKCLDHVGDG